MSPALEAALADHGARFGPRYGGYLSDHGPMAALALTGLGASDEAALGYLDRYCARLEPAADAPAYLALRARYLGALRDSSPEDVLGAFLPTLISGWARDAYHPLIRLACGYAWSLLEEMASGLAYLALCGPEPVIDQHAAAVPPQDASPAKLLETLAPLATDLAGSRTFTEQLSAVVSDSRFLGALFTVPDNVARLSRTALDVFASSHDFFALHLVTGAHAFRLLYPFAGPHRDAIFTMGIAGGYVAAGAPSFSRAVEPTSASGNWLDRAGRDEHRIKLAWSARAQAAFYGDPAYTDAAARYLAPRR